MIRKHNLMKCDIRERKDKYLLEIDLPGFQKENLKAYVENGYLVVNAVTDSKTDDKDKKFIRHERYHGEMTRSFYIGKDIKQEELKATYQHGVLKFEIPKLDEKALENKGKITIA